MAAAAQPFSVGPEPLLRGEEAGEGPPVVLCHGITATRRYVVHGSRALERAGHRVVSYDARGHGDSGPAPAGEDYGYPRLIDDLERIVAERVGEERFFLAGHSMGAHTAVGYALRHPERLAGLVVIGPTYRGEIRPETVAYWDGLAAALEGGGVDGFVEYLGREQGIAAAWRETVLRITRERMELHHDLGAIARALREVTASRPFDSISELEGLQVPALVVASNDEADPGHPFEVASLYSELLPNAQLVSEGEGESPLAWQGGRLSREIVSWSEALPSLL